MLFAEKFERQRKQALPLSKACGYPKGKARGRRSYMTFSRERFKVASRPLKNPLASWSQLDQLMGCALCCDRGGNVSVSLKQNLNRRPNKNKKNTKPNNRLSLMLRQPVCFLLFRCGIKLIIIAFFCHKLVVRAAFRYPLIGHIHYFIAVLYC